MLTPELTGAAAEVAEVESVALISVGIEMLTPEGRSVGSCVGAGWESVILGLCLRIALVSGESLYSQRGCYSRPDNSGCGLDKEWRLVNYTVIHPHCGDHGGCGFLAYIVFSLERSQ